MVKRENENKAFELGQAKISFTRQGDFNASVQIKIGNIPVEISHLNYNTINGNEVTETKAKLYYSLGKKSRDASLALASGADGADVDLPVDAIGAGDVLTALSFDTSYTQQIQSGVSGSIGTVLGQNLIAMDEDTSYLTFTLGETTFGDTDISELYAIGFESQAACVSIGKIGPVKTWSVNGTYQDLSLSYSNMQTDAGDYESTMIGAAYTMGDLTVAYNEDKELVDNAGNTSNVLSGTYSTSVVPVTFGYGETKDENNQKVDDLSGSSLGTTYSGGASILTNFITDADASTFSSPFISNFVYKF